MIVVCEALTLDGVIYGPGEEIPTEVWLRLPRRQRNELVNTCRVERVKRG